jgi:hypothetical protein
VRFEKGEHFVFEVADDDGSAHTVPASRAPGAA